MKALPGSESIDGDLMYFYASIVIAEAEEAMMNQYKLIIPRMKMI